MDILATMAQFNLNLLAGIVAGIISGLYSGLVVTRAARFYEIKTQALRLVRRIDFMTADDEITIERPMEPGDIGLLASELFHLKHKEAGMRLLEIDQTISTVQREAVEHGRHAQVFTHLHSDWQKRIRQTAPNWTAILLNGPL